MSDPNDAAPAARYLQEGDVDALFARIVALAPRGETVMSVESRWSGHLRWARNAITTSGDTREQLVQITRTVRGATGMAETNKLDDASLKLTIETAERIVLYGYENPDDWAPVPPQPYARPSIWSDATDALTGEGRSAAADTLVQPAIAAGLRAAGYLRNGIVSRGARNTRGLSAYYAATEAEYSVTVRNPQGTGSGWAGTAHHDWAKIDARALSDIAREKCVASANPRAVEPGRYTVILEPQAVYGLLLPAIDAMDRLMAENSLTVYTLSPGQSKIGMQVFDNRLTIRTDPADPDGGYLPFDGLGMPYRPVSWVERGVLKELPYDRRYAMREIGTTTPLPKPLGELGLRGFFQPQPAAFRVDGGATSLDEMIATTTRGFLVTRFSGVRVIDGQTLLTIGVTRDGLWLIEKGKVTYAAKNFRFTESPMFAFNNVEQIGVARRVHASGPVVVPSMKIRDFNFSSLADAV